MPRIPEETIEQIAAANDIVEVIGGYIPLKRAGSNFRALCPFHQEKTPSFNVNPSRQSYHCFGCGATGGVFKFVMAYENIDFPTAARKLAERGNVVIVEAEFSAEEGQRSRMKRRLLALHQQAAEWFHQNILKSPSAQAGRDYLKSRGLNSDIAKSWKIGYAPNSWDAFSRWGLAQGYTSEELIASGLVSMKDGEGGSSSNPEEEGYRTPQFYDRFRDRVMFPICNELSEVIGFSGRVLQADAKAAKYVNSPETPLFIKGNVLFGLHKTKRALLDKGFAIVCEGQIDLISAFEAGVKNVIAPQGTAFTEKQAHLLKRHVEEVVLCFDSDGAGQKATEKSLASLLAENIMVRVAEMPPGHDPDSLIRNLGAEAFISQIDKAKDFFDYQIDRFAATPDFSTARGKTQFARKMAGWASIITDSPLREAVGNKVSTRIEFSGSEFVKLLKEPPRQETAIETTGADLIQTEPLITNLIYVAVRNAEARAWLQQRDWKRVLGNEPNADLLIEALERDLNPDDNSSINSWLTTLSASKEATVRRILERGMLPIGKPSRNDAVVARPENVTGVLWHPMKTAQDAWLSLTRGQITRQITAISARMRTPDLPFEEIIKLQKETLDLRAQLTDIARPFSSNND
ncbi:MAG: DNA primase [Chthoniobacteraceae bacterium]